jgi:hypothetical protein
MLTTDEDEPTLRALERDAERNRAALIDTVGALQQRLSPSVIKHDVQSYVRSKKNGFLDSLEQRARENPLQTVALAAGAAYPLWSVVIRIPVPLLLIGAGLALARHSGSDGSAPATSNTRGLVDEARERLGQATDAVRDNLSDFSMAVQQQAQEGIASARRAADRLSDLKSEASQRADNLTAAVGEKLSETVGAVRGVSNQAVSRAGDMMSSDRLQPAGTSASDWVDETIGRNPLIIGAFGLAVGAVIAAALPATRQEDGLLGPAADHVKRSAKTAALEGVETAKGVATEVYRESARYAEEQGLSVEGAKEAAGQIVDKVQTAAANATGSPGQEQNSADASSHTDPMRPTRLEVQ